MDQEYPVNFYDLLKVDSHASQSEIKKAFRRLSKMYHPDLGGQEEGGQQQLLNQAMAVLGNPKTRKEHDEYWLHNGKKKALALPEGFYQIVKSLRRRLQTSLQQHEKELWSSLEDLTQTILKDLKRDLKKPKILPLILLLLMAIDIILGLLFRPILFALIILTPLTLLFLRNRSNGRFSIFQKASSREGLQSKAELMAKARIQRKLNRFDVYTEDLDLLLAILRRSYEKKKNQDMQTVVCLAFFLQGFNPVKYEKFQTNIHFTNRESSILAHFQRAQSTESTENLIKRTNQSMVQNKILKAHIFLLTSPNKEIIKTAKSRGIELHDHRHSHEWLWEITQKMNPLPDSEYLSRLKELTSFIKKLYR